MGEMESAGLPQIEPAAGMPRVDPEAPQAHAAENPVTAACPAGPGRFEGLRAVRESFPPFGSATGGLPPATPLNLDPPPAWDAIETLFEGATGGGAEAAEHDVPTLRPPSRQEAIAPAGGGNGRYGLIVALMACALVGSAGWLLAARPVPCLLSDLRRLAMPASLAADALARRIVTIESSDDGSAENALSSAVGAGQFLEGTWLEMIRAYRPDLAGRTEVEILGLRRDLELSREMVARFAERNAAMLERRCLPVTPGTLYLSHFAGGAGAAALLSAPDDADAADTMARADATGRTTRAMIVTANPFLESFTVADLKGWADARMIGAGASR
jgi:hypothetical protein